ncbi:hypothetical protein CRENBAI_012650 [Crenichthys baileyi]|uniref:Uncharacterized protein n=1 Tax=Crenichthys baileyi TaxID=28760 RepID=A0AAV9SBQ6_9TELE
MGMSQGLDPSKDPVYVGWVLRRPLRPRRPEVSNCELGRSSFTARKAGEASRQLLRQYRKTPNIFCRCGPPWLPLLDKSASTRNESWEMMEREGYSRPSFKSGKRRTHLSAAFEGVSEGCMNWDTLRHCAVT